MRRASIKQKGKRGPGDSKRSHVNEEIESSEVRLIDAEGGQVGVVPVTEALEAAKKVGLDLVEISPESDPPVCRMMDYGKFLFDAKKKRTEAKKKQKQSQIKEIKFRPTTEKGDYEVKLRNLIRFLESGDKAKVTLRFRGREMAHQDLGIDLMKRIEEDLLQYGVVEQQAKFEGRQVVMVLAPKRKN